MDPLISAVAQYLPFGIVLVAGVVWLMLPRSEKVDLLVEGLLTLLVVVVLIKAAGALHSNPRPFVVDPSIKPLFSHSADNGFPSDHATFDTAVAVLVTMYRQTIGLVLLACAVLAGAARVAAHVHHTQDIVAGVVIGAVAVGLAALAWRVIEPPVGRMFARGG